MKIQGKLIGALVPTMAALLFVGFLAAGTIASLGEHSQSILKDNLRSVLAVQGMVEALERLDSASLYQMVGHATEARHLVGKHQNGFEAHLRIEETNVTEPGEQQLVTRLRSTWEAYREALDRFMVASAPRGLEDYRGRLYPLFLDIKSQTMSILELNQTAMVARSAQVQETARRMNRVTFWAILGASLAGLLLSLSLGRHFLRPLAILGQSVRRVGEGDLQARTLLDGTDEIAELAREFNAMADAFLRYRQSSLGDLLQAQQMSQTVIDSLPDPVVIIDAAGNRLAANRAAELEMQAQELFGEKEPASEAGRAVKSLVQRIGNHVLEGKGPFLPKGFEDAVLIVVRDEERFFLPRGTPLLEEQRVVGATIVLQDVTRLRRFDQLKTDLVSTVAHEFRTPLTSLHMAIHLCLDETVGSVNEKQADLLYAARHDCERLQNLVNDLLDLSRIQSGRVEMKPQVVSVGSLLAAVLEQHGAVAAEAGIELVRVSTTIGDERVAADPERIPIVLTNFIVNAVRHTPRGGTIELRWRADDGKVRFEVADTGEGIPPDYVSRVFDRFCRVPGAKRGGVGLGLSIAREIVVAHGGEIGAESVVGKGSTFWFTLPLADARAN